MQVANPMRHRRDIPALTGLRFLAAFSVAVAHAASISLRLEQPPSWFSAIQNCLETTAGFGMTLFFVLSGFVIHYNYRNLISSKGAASVRLAGETGFKSVAHLDCAVKASAARGISVEAATYGGNCGAPADNATQNVAASCDGKENCTYSVDVKRLGDPAPNCSKDFAVSYSCPPELTINHKELPGEAGLGGIVSLNCAPEPPK
jgi:Acyltransferase family